MRAAGPAERPAWPVALAVLLAAGLVAGPALPWSPEWLGRSAEPVAGRAPLPPVVAVTLGLTLVLLARGVLLRRRAAWYGLVLLVALGLSSALSGPDEAWRVPSFAAALGALWLERGRFPVRPHPERVRAAVRTGALPVVLAVSAWLACGGRPAGTSGPVAGGTGPTVTSFGGVSWPSGALGLAGAAGLLILLVVLLAPHPAPPPAGEAERRRVAGLVAHPASDTLAPFALRRDRAYAFSGDGRAAVGYRVRFGVAVAGGDPVGDPDAHADAIRAFLARCRASGWRPAVLGSSGGTLPLWSLPHAIRYGDEVIIRPREFGLAGRRMRNVRQAVKRTENAGVTTRIVPERDLTPRLRERLRDVASRSLGGAAERGFTMNLDELLTGRHPGAVIAVAFDADGAPIAFQRYAAAGEGLSLDAMRRLPGGPNGVNERLIVEMIDYAARRGHGVVSLNFVPFRELLDARERTLPEKAGYRALHLLDPWIAAESLFLFDRKFHPSYKPRHVVFRSWSDVVWLAAAMLTLEFGPTRPVQEVAEEETELVVRTGAAPDGAPADAPG